MLKLFKPKEYFRPMTIGEAVSLLVRYGTRARQLAGGTDLLVKKPREVEYLIDISSLGLDYVKTDSEGLKIGASITISEIENSKIFRESPWSILAEAAHEFSDPSIRNVATIGGNVCSAVPSADMPPPLIALDAKARIVGSTGERVVPLEEFFAGPKKTVLRSDELLKEVQVPRQRAHTGVTFLKIGRTSRDIALVNVAVRVTLGSDGTCEDARIVLGAVAPIPMRAKKAEAMLKGKRMEGTLIERTAQIASEETTPISDHRASAQYRKKISAVLAKRALNQAQKRARAEE